MARPVAVLIPTLAFLLLLGTPFLRLEPGHPGRVDPAAGHREPRGRRRPVERLPGRRDLADHRPRDGRRLPDGRGQRPAHPRPRRGPRCGRRRRPGRGAVRRPQGSGDRRRPRRRRASRPCSPRHATSSRRSSPPGSTRLEEAYLRGSTVRLDAISPLAPLSPAGTEVVPLVRAVAVDGVTTAGRRARRRRVATSWPASPRRSRTRSR